MIESGPFPITTLFPNFVFPYGIDAAYSFNGYAWFVKGDKYTGVSIPGTQGNVEMNGTQSYDVNGNWPGLSMSSQSTLAQVL